MSFIQWLILGLVAYASGFGVRHYRYDGKTPSRERVIQFSLACFAVAVVVFTAINLLGLKKALDLAFIGVSSLVATGIFYYGLTTDTNNTMQLPD
ncbi:MULTISPECIES: hypothetical protein [unclassified Moraxella]|uniref:hypothetical protein n=1 Tax=unclassified Moraxella TaxID=2685852 RepID=UPI003AF8F9FD